MPTVDVFVYGTLRAEYPGWPDDVPSGAVIDALAPNHRTLGYPGEWRLYDHALWCLKENGRPGIPALGAAEGMIVTGDLVRVGAADFNELCRYEGFPHLYHLVGVEVQNTELGSWQQAFAFMPEPETLSRFGRILPSGDYVTALLSDHTYTA